VKLTQSSHLAVLVDTSTEALFTSFTFPPGTRPRSESEPWASGW